MKKPWNELLIEEINEPSLNAVTDFMLGALAPHSLIDADGRPTEAGHRCAKSLHTLAKLGSIVILNKQNLLPLLRNCEANDEDTILEETGL